MARCLISAVIVKVSSQTRECGRDGGRCRLLLQENLLYVVLHSDSCLVSLPLISLWFWCV